MRGFLCIYWQFLRRRFTPRMVLSVQRTPRNADAIMGAEELNHTQPEQEEERETANRRPQNRITQAEFLSWKRQKDADASARKAEAERKRLEDIAAGLVPLNGRELFQNEPWVFDNSRY